MPNDKRPVLYNENLNFFRNLVLQARLVWLLLRDSRVPLWLKALPIGSLVYLISPLDIVSDVFPVLGQIDDLMIVLAGLTTFVSLCPPDVVDEHTRSLTGRSAEWEVEKRPTSQKQAGASGHDESSVVEGSFVESPPEDSRP